jgi:SAM-dependent methyltransferase
LKRAEESVVKRVEFLFGLEISSSDTVVDIGCGAGDACVFAGQLGAEVIGIDIEASLIAQATERMRHVPARSFRGIVSDSSPIPLADDTASVVLCTEVLEHVDDPPRFLSELARIGRPGARYLISVPDPTSESVMRVVAPPWYFEKPIHQHVFEHEQLDALVCASGLEIETRTSGGFQESIKWFIHMAIGTDHMFAPPSAPILDDWERVMAALKDMPRGSTVIRELDRLIPKSQVVIARKPGSRARLAHALDPSAWRGSRLKRWFRDGLFRVAGFDVRWSVRRSRVRTVPEQRVA